MNKKQVDNLTNGPKLGNIIPRWGDDSHNMYFLSFRKDAKKRKANKIAKQTRKANRK